MTILLGLNCNLNICFPFSFRYFLNTKHLFLSKIFDNFQRLFAHHSVIFSCLIFFINRAVVLLYKICIVFLFSREKFFSFLKFSNAQSFFALNKNLELLSCYLENNNKEQRRYER